MALKAIETSTDHEEKSMKKKQEEASNSAIALVTVNMTKDHINWSAEG